MRLVDLGLPRYEFHDRTHHVAGPVRADEYGFAPTGPVGAAGSDDTNADADTDAGSYTYADPDEPDPADWANAGPLTDANTDAYSDTDADTNAYSDLTDADATGHAGSATGGTVAALGAA